MKKINTILILALFLLSFTNSYIYAVEFEGIEIPNGLTSFADLVVSYTKGAGVKSPYDDINNPIGIPDWSTQDINGPTYLSLGTGGVVILKFVDNSLTTSGDDTMDLWVFEAGSKIVAERTIEPISIEISSDAINWISVGSLEGSTSGVDIDKYISAGVIEGERYSFIKITDLLPETTFSPCAGADIDAVAAISSAPPTDMCIDTDRDGVIDLLDNCQNTPSNSYVDKYGCPFNIIKGDSDGDGKLCLSDIIYSLQLLSEDKNNY